MVDTEKEQCELEKCINGSNDSSVTLLLKQTFVTLFYPNKLTCNIQTSLVTPVDATLWGETRRLEHPTQDL